MFRYATALTLMLALSALGALASAHASELTAPKAAMELLNQTKPPVILDVRSPREFYSGHLPGAKNLDLYGPDFDRVIGQLDPDAPYLVYCQSGRRSAAAVKAMEKAGLKNIKEIEGGFGNWQRARLPVEREGGS